MTLCELQTLSRPVARSFHLSLILLPAPMRQPALLAYLLARLSDAVADAPGPFLPEREELLLNWLEDPPRGGLPDEFFPATARPGEQALWARREELVGALHESPQRSLIAGVWRDILQGQLEDVRRERIGGAGEPLPWPEVVRYAGLVAGSVGIFWTRLISATCPAALRGPSVAMLRDGHAYGVALQLVNILRDAAGDRAAGRVYLHPQDCAQAFLLVEKGLAAGRRYGTGLRGWRLRWATGLPERIARDMLPTLQAGESGGKISRSRLARLALDAFWHATWPS